MHIMTFLASTRGGSQQNTDLLLHVLKKLLCVSFPSLFLEEVRTIILSLSNYMALNQILNLAC